MISGSEAVSGVLGSLPFTVEILDGFGRLSMVIG
jgi:hypothetical protein